MANINKSIYKVLLVLLIMLFIFAISNVSHAVNMGDIIKEGSDFLEEGKSNANQMESQGTAVNEQNMKGTISDIYYIIFPIGIATTVIVGGVIGIKFMMSSTEEKAKVKESLIPYVAGCIVIYGAFGIWKLAIEIFSALA